tara:strand:+ start:272 stop:517 length:246 start_codon:yes stop_codon:yes gene_type:complete
MNPIELDWRKFLVLVKGLSHCEGSAFIYQATADERAKQEAYDKLAAKQGRVRPQITEELSPEDAKRLYSASNSRSRHTDSS